MTSTKITKSIPEQPRRLRCAIYTRKSSEEGLNQEYNSLDAQRDAGEAYIASQKHEGWMMVPEFYDDGGFSGGNLERPALKRLLDDIRAGKIDIVVVYKVDRISRSLTDFASIVQIFDQHNVSFVSVTQNFNTTSSMGRLTLNSRVHLLRLHDDADLHQKEQPHLSVLHADHRQPPILCRLQGGQCASIGAGYAGGRAYSPNDPIP